MTEKGTKRLFSDTKPVASIFAALVDVEETLNEQDRAIAHANKKLKAAEEEKKNCEKVLGEERARSAASDKTAEGERKKLETVLEKERARSAAFEKTTGEERKKWETVLAKERARSAAFEKTTEEERKKHATALGSTINGLEESLRVETEKHREAMKKEQARFNALEESLRAEKETHEKAFCAERERHEIVLKEQGEAARQNEETRTSVLEARISELVASVQQKQDDVDTWRSTTELDKILSQERAEESKRLMFTAADALKAIEENTQALKDACTSWINSDANI